MQRLTGRILPDLLGETRAEVRLRQDLEERAARLRARRGVRKTNPSFGLTWADPQARDELDAERKTVPAAIPAAEPLSLEEPVLATVEGVALAVVEPVEKPSLSPPDSSPERTGSQRGRRGRRGFQAGRRGAERQGASAGLRAGEKWKRRLPRVCW
jgi:hypothetical protein